MNFFLIIGRNKLYTYVKNASQIEPQFIEGSNYFQVNFGNISGDVSSYMETLANEKNLGTIAKLEFDILENSNSKFSAEVIRAFGENVKSVYHLNEVLENVMNKLLRDKKLMINEYGVNYDGYSYKLKNNTVVKEEYDLLSKSIYCDDIVERTNKMVEDIKFIEEEKWNKQNEKNKVKNKKKVR